MKRSSIFTMLIVLLMGSCKMQSDSTESASADALRDSDLVGTWIWTSPQGMDPPMDVSFCLEENGDFIVLIHLKRDGDYVPPSDPVQYEKGRWWITKSEGGHDVIHVRYPDSDEAHEVSIVGDTMIWKPLPKDRHEDWTLDEAFVVKRIKQE